MAEFNKNVGNEGWIQDKEGSKHFFEKYDKNEGPLKSVIEGIIEVIKKKLS